MGWQIIIGTVPIGLAGYLAQDQIRSAFRSLKLTAVVLIVFGVALGVADRIGTGTRELHDFGLGDGLLCGLAQALALIPGVSRSGATTTMGLALGFSRPAAAEYAFLLAVPAVFASGLYELRDSLRKPGPYSLKKIALATCVSFAVGLATISLLMRFISKRSFLPFSLYRTLARCHAPRSAVQRCSSTALKVAKLRITPELWQRCSGGVPTVGKPLDREDTVATKRELSTLRRPPRQRSAVRT